MTDGSEHGMRLLVCGGRDFNNIAFIWRWLDQLYRGHVISALMHGGARGVDSIAGEWAKTKPIDRYVCKAEWDQYGKAAGHKRNARMLEWKPDVVVAFPGGRGTADIVRQARAAGVKVIEVPLNASGEEPTR